MKASSLVAPVLLIAAAVGASAYAYFDRGSVSDADREERRRDLFPRFRVEEVQRVELDHGSEKFVIERGPDGDRVVWRMTSPYAEIADQGAVDVLLRELDLAKRIREVDTADVRDATPRAKGRVRVGKIDYAFTLGGDALAPQGAAYLTIEGDGTFVVERALKVQLLRTAEAYRDRAMVPYGASDVARLEIHGPDARLTLERSGASFRVLEANRWRAARDAVDRVFGALADARADVFLDGGASSAAPLSVVVTPRDGKRPAVRLSFDGPCPLRDGEVAVTRDGTWRVRACVPKPAEERLETAPDTLVDKRLFFAHADEIEELRLESLLRPSDRVDVARHGTSWHERAPTDHELTADEGDSTDALVGDVARAEGTDLLRSAEGFAASLRATIERSGGGGSEIVDIGAPGPDGSALAHRLDDGAWMRVSRDVERRLEPHPVALRSRVLDHTPFEAADVVGIDDTCGPTPQKLVLRDGRWTLKAPAGFVADDEGAAALADALARAKADGWIAEKDDGEFGLESSAACSVTLALAPKAGSSDPRRVTVTFGGTHAGGVYARTASEPAVFVAPAALREQASHPLIDRTDLRVDAVQAMRAVVVRGSDRRAVTPAATADSSAGDAESASEEKLAQAVEGIYARDALHLGGPLAGEGFDRPTLEIDLSGKAGGVPVQRHVAIGALTHVGPSDVYFARVGGVDATFAVPRIAVDRVLDAW